MRQTRSKSSIAALVVCAALIVACSGDDGAASRDTDDGDGGETTTGAPSCSGDADGVLTLGGLEPQSGELAPLGPPQAAAATLAITEINAAGGVLGKPINYVVGDSGDDQSQTASATVEAHLSAGADAIIGTAPAGAAPSVLEQITDACVIQFSPRVASMHSTGGADNELYFTTAPSDVLLGQAIAELMAEDGNSTAAILASQGTYGEGLLDVTSERFEDQGGEVVVARAYDPDAESFAEEADAVIAENPDALVLIGLDETARLVNALLERGFTPDANAIYLADANVGNALGEAVEQPGALHGVKGVVRAAEVSDDFRATLLQVDPALVDFVVSAETYDAVVVTALAASVAGSDDPAAIAAQIDGVTRDGETCAAFTDCLALIEGGTDIDYDGQSGPLEFDDQGEPTVAGFAVLSYAPDRNVIDSAATVFRQVSL